ncbi:single-stranded DNA-binding protein [Tardibacter chloracetimidivorans]|uniref:Single-stranded DNA-binding protein n=1 Tax=Tardibacter chloracetimidivorans TaxID=1921510 RepID=A0A1L3ZRP0_9SPHN|nr:single-stranded DNA-binding protein [Tardibacter chloracetimidivorans]API58293.1 single-stranded DNA-binding protein [Tardibacter chloracetimidivorans]
MLNRATLIGHLGRDPEARTMQNGGEVVTLNVATSEHWKDQSGQRQERTEWHKVVIFNENLVDVAKKYLRKGSRVFAEGQIQTRKWTDNAGIERYSTEIVLQRFRGALTLLDKRESDPGRNDYSSHQTREAQGASAGGGAGASAPFDSDLDDDVPF